MAFLKYLLFDGIELPAPVSYEVNLADVEAESGGETEEGTKQRDVVRFGVVEIAVSFLVTASWLKVLTEFKQKKKISAQYLDPNVGELSMAEMFVDGFKVKLERDSKAGGLWAVSFVVKEF